MKNLKPSGKSNGAFAFEPFQALVSRMGDDVSCIEIRGELDFAFAGQVDELIAAERERGASLLVIDLAGLQFIDSSGIAALVRHRSSDGFELVTAGAHGAVARTFELVGLGKVVPNLGTVEEAIDGHAPRPSSASAA